MYLPTNLFLDRKIDKNDKTNWNVSFMLFIFSCFQLVSTWSKCREKKVLCEKKKAILESLQSFFTVLFQRSRYPIGKWMYNVLLVKHIHWFNEECYLNKVYLIGNLYVYLSFCNENICFHVFSFCVEGVHLNKLKLDTLVCSCGFFQWYFQEVTFQINYWRVYLFI